MFGPKAGQDGIRARLRPKLPPIDTSCTTLSLPRGSLTFRRSFSGSLKLQKPDGGKLSGSRLAASGTVTGKCLSGPDRASASEHQEQSKPQHQPSTSRFPSSLVLVDRSQHLHASQQIVTNHGREGEVTSSPFHHVVSVALSDTQTNLAVSIDNLSEVTESSGTSVNPAVPVTQRLASSSSHPACSILTCTTTPSRGAFMPETRLNC